MIPLRHDDTVSKRYGINLIVGSPVISVVIAINHETGKILYTSTSLLTINKIINLSSLYS